MALSNPPPKLDWGYLWQVIGINAIAIWAGPTLGPWQHAAAGAISTLMVLCAARAGRKL